MFIDTGATPPSVRMFNYNTGPNTLGSEVTGITDKCYLRYIPYPSGTAVQQDEAKIRPYYEANCRFRNFEISNTSTVYFDTSGGMLNIFFDPPVVEPITSPATYTSYTGEYLGSNQSGQAGQSTFIRTHCTPAWSNTVKSPDTNYTVSGRKPCNKTIKFESPSTTTQTSFQEKCVYTATTPPTACTAHDVSELLNVFSLGSGNFTLKGNAGVLGFNLIAPNATVTLLGGGKPKVIDFMGRIWADDIRLVGNVNIRTLSANPAFCSGIACPDTGSLSLFDYVGRSFTQSSGFGLAF
jgi:hypothetical protein